MSQGKRNEAVKSLKFLRSKYHNVDQEIEEITKFVEETKGKKFSFELLKSKVATKSVLIGLGLMVFQQFGGANAVVFNTTTIFQVQNET